MKEQVCLTWICCVVLWLIDRVSISQRTTNEEGDCPALVNLARPDRNSFCPDIELYRYQCRCLHTVYTTNLTYVPSSSICIIIACMPRSPGSLWTMCNMRHVCKSIPRHARLRRMTVENATRPELIPLLTKARISRQQTAPDAPPSSFPEASSTVILSPLSIYTVYHALNINKLCTYPSPHPSPTSSCRLERWNLERETEEIETETQKYHSGGTNQQILLDPHYPSTASLTPFLPQSTLDKRLSLDRSDTLPTPPHISLGKSRNTRTELELGHLSTNHGDGT